MLKGGLFCSSWISWQTDERHRFTINDIDYIGKVREIFRRIIMMVCLFQRIHNIENIAEDALWHKESKLFIRNARNIMSIDIDLVM